jgi:hypothetical protein
LRALAVVLQLGLTPQVQVVVDVALGAGRLELIHERDRAGRIAVCRFGARGLRLRRVQRLVVRSTGVVWCFA